MDSYFIQINLDRIDWIDWIFYFSGFLTKPEKYHPPDGGNNQYS